MMESESEVVKALEHLAWYCQKAKEEAIKMKMKSEEVAYNEGREAAYGEIERLLNTVKVSYQK